VIRMEEYLSSLNSRSPAFNAPGRTLEVISIVLHTRQETDENSRCGVERGKSRQLRSRDLGNSFER
jgi:hypothetical protein